MAACASTKQTVSKKVSSFRVQDSRELEARDSLRLEVRDSVMETKTITITKNEAGDTLRLSVVTERNRIRDRAQERSKEVEVRVVRDTAFIEKRDSVSTTTNIMDRTDGKPTRLQKTLRLVLWIIIAFAGLVVIIKIRRI